MQSNQISVTNLNKTYNKGAVEAVRDISFEVEGGQIYALLGPNGAGKSTTVKILTTLALPSSGQALVGGYDVVSQAGQVRSLTGVALQEIGIDPMMMPLELLVIQGRLFGLSAKEAKARAQKMAELVQLTDALDRRPESGADIEKGYFDKLLLTPVKRSILLIAPILAVLMFSLAIFALRVHTRRA